MPTAFKRFAILTTEQKPAQCAINGKPSPTQHKRAPKSEQFEFLGKMYVVQQNPRELREFIGNVQKIDTSMGTLSAVTSVSGLHVYCREMARRMPDWLCGSDQLRRLMRRHAVPHCVRKLWLRVEGLWRTTAAGRSFTPAGLTSQDFAKCLDDLQLRG